MPLLDVKMSKDLNELYQSGQISDAVALNGAGVLSWPSSTQGNPGYYGGDRNAKTVMVMLNPGGNASDVDSDYKNIILPSKKWHPKQPSWSNFTSYYNLFQDLSANGGSHDRNRLDYFDLKQAAFLKRWPNCGVNIPQNFPVDKNTFYDAKENVLNEKLQLELIPYASNKFGINKSAITNIVPYLDIIFDEIFSKEREYIIFAARLFEEIFKAYNKAKGKKVIDLSLPKERSNNPLKLGGKLKGSCRVIHITYKGKCYKAIMANTFPSQALSYALDSMVRYGEFCYGIYQKYP